MDIHQNARLTLRSREALALYVLRDGFTRPRHDPPRVARAGPEAGRETQAPAQAVARPEGRNTIGFLREGAGFFAERNVQVRALLTDNGSAYRSHKFRNACAEMQIKHRRTRPYTPRTNGKAERFMQTALREWAYAEHGASSERRDAQLQPRVDFYNQQRPHGSLNDKP